MGPPPARRQVFHAVNLKAALVCLVALVGACGSSQTKAAHSGESDPPIAPATLPPHDGVVAAARSADTVTSAQVGAEQWAEVLAAVAGKRVACVVNHTSRSGGQHLVDRLVGSGVAVVRVFAPEHGFRGLASDGERVPDGRDPGTGLPVVSLYGKTKRPSRAMLADVDLVLFDIQDVGLRYYTYVSTMHYVMDAAAEYDVPVLVLDRPNPLGRLVDGPVLDTAYRSFVGMHEVPVAHGLTVGELARMINGEGWLAAGRQARLSVVPVRDYAVGQVYLLPEKPSPNLPNQNAIYRYATLCYFEGTVASVGRGTDFPFEVVGHPRFRPRDFSFTPEVRPGALYAPLKGERCYGLDLRGPIVQPDSIDWALLRRVRAAVDVAAFVDRPSHLDALAGRRDLRDWLASERDVASFRESYRDAVQRYLERRRPYLLYPRVIPAHDAH